MNFFKKIFEKRAKGAFIPLDVASGGNSPRQSGNLSALARGVAWYHNLLLNAPMKIMKGETEVKDHWLPKLLTRPCRWLNKSELFFILCEQYWLAGNFIAYLKYNRDGKLESINPFPEGSCYAHALSSAGGEIGDGSDPIQLMRNGFYYQSSFEVKSQTGQKKNILSRFSQSEIFHLKHLRQAGSNKLMGTPVWTAFPETISFAQNVLDTAEAFAESGLISPSIVKGVSETKYQKKQEIQKALEALFKQKKQFITLNESIDLVPAIMARPDNMIMALSSMSSVDCARLLSLPVSLLDRPDANVDSSAQGLRETHRWATRFPGAAFAKIVSEKFTELIESDLQVEFCLKSAIVSDLRESSTAIKALTEAGTLPKKEATEFLPK